ncbi:MAG: FapA family protein [Thermodesulfobacteriota bacterium]|nr:FapA family protein [Thermodesulfobacteriota bacterium]
MSTKKTRVPRFGNIAIDNGFATHMDIFGAIKEQKRLKNVSQTHQLIGDILIEMGVITEEQRDFILTTQNALREELPADTDQQAKKEVIQGLEDSPEEVEKPVEKSADMGEGSVEKSIGYYIKVSEDKLNASISPKDSIDHSATLTEIKELLQRKGILYGIMDDKSINRYLEEPREHQKTWIIAQGKAPEPGIDPDMRLFFDNDPIKTGTMTEEGFIDWKDHGQIPQVKEGDCIAEIDPGRAGTEGKDIYGQSVPPPKLNILDIKYGRNAYKSEDGLRIYSKIDGRPQLSGNRYLDVFTDLRISGDIGIETGHVNFDGCIDVSGSINKGYQVNGKSLRCKEINGAEIQVDGDIIVMGGVFGANIKSGGKLKVGHINRSKIEAVGDIAVENEIVDSAIETNGSCVIEKGTILSSEIVAKKGVKTKEIGTEVAKPSSLFVGIDNKVKRDIKTLRDEIAEKEMRLKDLESLVVELKNRSDGINIELGEIAQEQDGSMVRHRHLVEKMKESAQTDDNGLMERVEEAKKNLEARIKQIDKIVEKLMEEDEQILENIDEHQKEITEIGHEVGLLESKIDHVIDLAEQDEGVPVVKVSGNVFPGTIISGPHSSITLDKQYHKVNIFETKIKCDTSSQERRMRISSPR